MPWILRMYHLIQKFIWHDLPPLSIQEQQALLTRPRCLEPSTIVTIATTDVNTNNYHNQSQSSTIKIKNYNDTTVPNKHLLWYHPVLTCGLYYGIVIPLSFVVHDAMVPYYLASSITVDTNHHDHLSTFWLGVWFLSYAVLILVWRLYCRKETPVRDEIERFSSAATATTNHTNNVVSPGTLRASTPPKRTPRLLQSPQYPYIVLYEYCWLCNVTLVISGLALLEPVLVPNHYQTKYIDRSPMIMAYVILIGIDQLLWYIDLFLYLCTGHCPIGVAKYVFFTSSSSSSSTSTTHQKKNDTIITNIKHRQQQHWSNRVTWTHHLWTIPLVLYAVQYQIHFVSYLLSIVYLILNVTLSRYLIPSHIAMPTSATNNDSPIRGKSSSATTTTTRTRNDPRLAHRYELYYLNINLSHEVYQDVQHIPFLRISSSTIMPWYQYIFALTWRWQCFNTMVYLLFCYICQNV